MDAPVDAAAAESDGERQRMDRRAKSLKRLGILWWYFIVWLFWSTDGHLVSHDASPTITQIATIVHIIHKALL